MTFAVGVAAEVVALLVVGPSVDRIGRHNCVSLGQLLGGGACLACAMVRGGTTQAALAAVGKFGCAGAVGCAAWRGVDDALSTARRADASVLMRVAVRLSTPLPMQALRRSSPSTRQSCCPPPAAPPCWASATRRRAWAPSPRPFC
jgi:MFS family permease